MNVTDLQTLLDYHYWARDRVLAAAETLTPEQFTRDLGSSFKSVRDTLLHLLGAETAWCMRWHGNSPSALLSAHQFSDVASIRTAWAELETKIRKYVEENGEAGVTRVIDYKLLNGTPGSSALWQMLQHVVNHGSYHRGQVTTMIRQLGGTPAKSLDMIAFYRERTAKT